MTVWLTNEKWAEARQKDFAERTEATKAFWPELKRAFLDLSALEPAKSHVIVAPEDSNPRLFVITAGIIDLKLTADPLSDTVFYAFTSSTLKKLIPTESAILHYGQLKITRGLWGVVDGPGNDVHRVFADDPQSVQHFPLAERFAQWALDQLLGGYPAVTALQDAATVNAGAKHEATKKEAKRGGSRSKAGEAA